LANRAGKIETHSFTLVETMVTLVIVATLLSLGIITLRGYLPKQHLLTSVSTLENLFLRAQQEAVSRSQWVCVRMRGTDQTVKPQGFEVWVDADGDHFTTTFKPCGSAGDLKILEASLKKEVGLRHSGASAPGCMYAMPLPCVVWFNPQGNPMRCGGLWTIPSEVYCAFLAPPPVPPSNTCVPFDVQAVVVNPKLATTARAREVEVLRRGLIQVVKPGERGQARVGGSSIEVWARGATPQAANGCECLTPACN
jgi:type II secretory pathway pseudopilin PulG